MKCIALVSLLASQLAATVSAQTNIPLLCSSDDDCTPGRPKCCGGFCLGCCTDDDCPEDLACRADGTCLLTCFSGESFLDILGKGPVRMKDAQVGDRVRTTGDAFESVYAFGHREPETEAYFLQIFLDNNAAEPLEISTDHMLMQATKSSPVPASTLQVGDALVLADGTTATVSKIAGVTRTGIYAPLSESGLIAVNNVVASNYVTAQQDSGRVKIGSFETPLTWHWVSHAGQAPHRLWCKATGSCAAASGTPYQVALVDWVSHWVSSHQAGWVQYVVVPTAMVPTVIVLGALQATEYVVNSYALLLFSVVVGAGVANVVQQNKKVLA